MEKTDKQGVYTRSLKNGDRTFYITLRQNGRSVVRKLGTASEGWTIIKASKERESMRHSEPTAPQRETKKTLDDIAEAYLDSIAHLSDGKNTRGRYKNHISPELGSHRIDEIETADVMHLKKLLTVKISPKTKRPLSPKTIDDIINLLHTIYLYRNKTSRNKIESPAASDKVSRFKPENHRLRYLTPKEIETLLWHIENRNSFITNRNGRQSVTEELMIFVRLALSTGARLSSLLSIRVQDVNLQDGTISVINHKVHGRRYTAFIHPNMMSDLIEWLKGLRGGQYVFGRGDIPLHRVTMEKRLKPVLDRCFNEGVTDTRYRVVIHTLRHTFGSLLAIQGTPIYTIKKLMDHSSIEQTMIYAKLAEDSGKADVGSLRL